MPRGIEDFDGLTLAEIGDGALEEKFQVELEKVLKNIDDLNAADGKREIQLKITFTPNTKRSSADIMLFATSKLQPDVPTETMAILGREGAKPMAWEHNPDQMKLPMAEGLQEVPKTSIGGVK